MSLFHSVRGVSRGIVDSSAPSCSSPQTLTCEWREGLGPPVFKMTWKCGMWSPSFCGFVGKMPSNRREWSQLFCGLVCGMPPRCACNTAPKEAKGTWKRQILFLFQTPGPDIGAFCSFYLQNATNLWEVIYLIINEWLAVCGWLFVNRWSISNRQTSNRNLVMN